MIVNKKDMTRGIEIDLTGPDGNSFFLIGTARRMGREVGMSADYISEMVTRMTSGDYENLIKVFDDEFGSIVTLIR